VAENNPTSAHSRPTVIFINPTSTYAITPVNHHDGRLGLGLV